MKPDSIHGGLSPQSGGGLSRRNLIKLAAVSTIGVAFGAGAAAGLSRLTHSDPAAFVFFTDAEAALLIPICEQIIPRDDTPGATDVGVIYYIDRQVSNVLARHQSDYRQGLESFRKTCNQCYKMPFEHLSFDKQTEALQMIESGRAPKELWNQPSQQAFFNLVLDHTRQGFYGSPRHGGNRDYASYRMMGLAYPNLIGQNRYSTPRA